MNLKPARLGQFKIYRQLTLILAILLVSTALSFLILKSVLPAQQRPMRGFAAYYTASKLLVEGKLGPRVYDDDWFVEQVHHYTTQPVHEILTPTLPTVSLLALPLVGLPPQTAHRAWNWLSLACLLAGLGLLLQTLRQTTRHVDRPLVWAALLALAFVFPPVAANFHEDQALIFFFMLFTVVGWGAASRREGPAGLALGAALILKTTGVALWFLPLVQRRRRLLAAGLGLIAVIFTFSLPWLGPATWLAYLQAAARVTGSPLKAVTAYQTTAGFFSHLFRFDPAWNPAPLADWPGLAALLPLLVGGAAVLLTCWWGRWASTLHLLAALTPLSVVLLPVAEEHHFVILLIPIFILVAGLLEYGGSRWAWGLLGLALALLVAPIRYESLALSRGWLALLAYPRLYGGWLLWGLAVSRPRNKFQG